MKMVGRARNYSYIYGVRLPKWQEFKFKKIKVMKKYQVILKNGKNGDKLYSSVPKAIKANSGNIQTIKEITMMDFSKVPDGRSVASGKQFSSRKNQDQVR